MRRCLLIAALVALGAAGVAYGQAPLENVYFVNAKIKPKQSGTKTHPLPIATTIGYRVETSPGGQRPRVVQKLIIDVNGIRAHPNDFRTCSTSRLNNPKQGPKTCPKKSLVGTGFLIVDVGSSSNSSILLSCRVDVSVYNGGGSSLSYYVFANPANKNECPSSAVQPIAFPAKLREAGTVLVQTINVPFSLRHPGGNSAVDAAVVSSSVTFPRKTRKLKGKTVGFAESIGGCPANHRRANSVTFETEDGSFQTAFATIPCK